MKYNLEPHSNQLSYPHYTKKTENEICIVTSPGKVLKAGDIIHAGNKRNHIFQEIEITEILEQRSAVGEHKIDSPIFQRCRI